jgi:hypothetical protein
VSPREEEFAEYCRLFELLPLDVTSVRFSCAHNEFSLNHITTLCTSLQDRELQKFGLCLSGCGLQKESSLYLLDWLQFGIFVEDKLDLDFSV